MGIYSGWAHDQENLFRKIQLRSLGFYHPPIRHIHNVIIHNVIVAYYNGKAVGLAYLSRYSCNYRFWSSCSLVIYLFLVFHSY